MNGRDGITHNATAMLTGIALLGLLMGCRETPTDAKLEQLTLDKSRAEFLVSEAFPDSWDLVCVLFHYQSAAKEMRKHFGSGWTQIDDQDFYGGDYMSLILVNQYQKKYTAKQVIVRSSVQGVDYNIFLSVNNDMFRDKSSGKYCGQRETSILRKRSSPNDQSVYLLLDKVTDG